MQDKLELGLLAQGVSMTYRRGNLTTAALSDCSLDVPVGGWASLIGASGCGKSTLLRIMADLVKPTAGHVGIGGVGPAEARALRSFALVSQQSVLLPWRKVLADVELGLEVARVPVAERRRRAEEAIALVGLAEIMLAHIAASTRRITVGSGVRILSSASPLRTVEEMSLLHVLTGGRVEYGIGQGSFQPKMTMSREEKAAQFQGALDEVLDLLRTGQLDICPKPSPAIAGKIWAAARDEPTLR